MLHWKYTQRMYCKQTLENGQRGATTSVCTAILFFFYTVLWCLCTFTYQFSWAVRYGAVTQRCFILSTYSMEQWHRVDGQKSKNNHQVGWNSPFSFSFENHNHTLFKSKRKVYSIQVTEGILKTPVQFRSGAEHQICIDGRERWEVGDIESLVF